MIVRLLVKKSESVVVVILAALGRIGLAWHKINSLSHKASHAILCIHLFLKLVHNNYLIITVFLNTFPRLETSSHPDSSPNHPSSVIELFLAPSKGVGSGHHRYESLRISGP